MINQNVKSLKTFPIPSFKRKAYKPAICHYVSAIKWCCKTGINSQKIKGHVVKYGQMLNKIQLTWLMSAKQRDWWNCWGNSWNTA